MKKLLIMVMAAILLVGCSSSKSSEGIGGKVASSKMTEKDEKKDKEKDSKKSDSDKKEKTKTEPSGEDITMDKATSDSKSENSSTAKKSTSQNTGSSGTSNKNETPTESNKPTPPPVTPPPVQEPTPAAPTNQSAMADQVFAQINAYRQQNGKEPFQLSNALKMTSEAHALNMASIEGLWHSGDAVECITNADDPFRAWVNSPPHNEILLCNNTEAAVGIYYYNGYYYSVFQCQW